ncbi:hypothetical protein Hanom_Chr13g01201941 [Helianthus anomalus]
MSISKCGEFFAYAYIKRELKFLCEGTWFLAVRCSHVGGFEQRYYNSC